MLYKNDVNITKHGLLHWIIVMSTMPIIYGPLIFMILLDIAIEIYHHICFPIYGIEKVKRKEYIQVIDRAKLQYLHVFEKLGCMYCGYANGLFLYVKEIAGRTEKYMCGIMHANKPGYIDRQDHKQKDFSKYDDPESFAKKYL
jgi:hypothetical protein